jgi:predicted nucleic-acid-binding protein
VIGLDTNVLLRLLMRDDRVQYEAAARFVKETIAGGEALFINRVVLAELVWALSRTYRRSREEISTAIEQILRTAEFEVEGSTAAWTALHEYRQSGVDFTDSLVGVVNRAAGCSATATFDRKAGRLETFKGL